MNVHVHIDDTGVQRYVRDALGRFARAGDILPGRILPIFRQAIVKQFDTEGAYGGKPWAPLKDSTLARKPAGLPILQRSGELYDTFAVAGNKRLEVVVERSGRGLTQIDFIVDVPYAYRHQQGQPGRMPAREVIPDPMPPSFIAALRRVVSGALVGAVLPEE